MEEANVKIKDVEQRQLAANTALHLLSLGPPIQPYVDKPGIFNKFNVDIAVRERYEKQEKSWARLNVSDTVEGMLSRRNSGAKCLCWKIILCSQMNSGYKMGATGLWLISKLMPSGGVDVVVSSPGLAVWKKCVPSQSGADPTPTCSFSVIRDTTFGSLDEAVPGASAVLFLASESIPWELERVHLHNLLMSIPSGACLPLMILCGSCDNGFSSAIIDELGLHNIDKSWISGFLLVLLIENQQMEHLGGFFSDRRLRGADLVGRGSSGGHEIENHKVKLENSLTHYLTHTSMMTGVSLATKEAHVTLQTCARLELQGSSYCIVPPWDMIFSRIISWCLQNLSAGEFSSAYISKYHDVALPSSDLDVGLEASLRSSYYPSTSLDEMIEVSCSFPLLVKGKQRPQGLQHLPQRDSNTNAVIVNTSDLRDAENNLAPMKLLSANTACTHGLNTSGDEALMNGNATREAENSSRLLKQCDLLQYIVMDEKLSIYF